MAFVVVFFVSGVAGLVYEIVFAKELGLTFGSTSRAHATVLATYLGGLALGAAIGASVLERRKSLRPARLGQIGPPDFATVHPWSHSTARSVALAAADRGLITRSANPSS